MMRCGMFTTGGDCFGMFTTGGDCYDEMFTTGGDCYYEMWNVYNWRRLLL